MTPLWNGPRFETPISIEVLMIGKPNRYKNDKGEVTWADIAIDYKKARQVTSGLQQDGLAPPFARQSDAPGLGVHLIWTLPKSLRSGLQLPDGTVEFPLVPDRWIITRTFVNESGETIDHTCWILESNFSGSLLDGGTNAYPVADSDTAITYIGKRFDYGNWSDDQDTGIALTAVAPGDIGFSAVYNNVENQFAFYDDMKGAATGTYSYSVVGWYANSTDDVMYNLPQEDGSTVPWQTEEQWQQLMQILAWKTRNLDKAMTAWEAWKTEHNITGTTPYPEQMVLPAQSIYHGLIFDLQWKGPDQAYDTGAPQGQPAMAIGNNPIESIAAWLADTMGAPEAERLINALNLDFIYDFTSDQVLFEEKMHDAEFSGIAAGKQWQVSNERNQSSGAGSMTVTMSQENTTTLVELNELQGQFNNLEKHLASTKAELFSCGYKLPGVSVFDGDLLKQVKTSITDLQALLNTQESQLATLDTQIKAKAQDLESKLPDTLFLISTEASRYYQANDPVLLVANGASNQRLTGTGEASDGYVIGRFTGQNMTSLTVTASLPDGDKTVVFDIDVLSKYVTFPATTKLPKETLDIWVESLLLNTDNAGLLAIWFFKQLDITPASGQVDELAASIKQQQSLVWNASAHPSVDPDSITVVAKYSGVLPEKISVQEWEPPWTPLYFDWEVNWYPGADDAADVLKNWQYGEMDFQWTSTAAIDASDPIKIQGRTLMNSQVIEGLYQKLVNFVGNSTEIGKLPYEQQNELKEVIETLKDYDILTQSLTGFTEQLILRNPSLINALVSSDSSINPELTTITRQTEDEQHWVPEVGSTSEPDLPFSPFRAGHFTLERFWLIDSFGRYYPASDGGIVPLVRAESMVTPGGDTNKDFVQLPPRWNQPAQLNLKLLDADNDDIVSNSSELTSPICGWVLSNHLDDALLVYDALGYLLGQVQAVTRDVGTALRWDPVPGKNFPYGEPPQIDNLHLKQFVDNLLAIGANNAGVLNSLMSVIDSTLWQTDNLGKRENSNLSVLVGNPIAVVRGKTSLGLMGDPVYDQNWDQTGKHNDDDVTGITFPVRVGDSGIKLNGVVGYFKNDDYSHFNAVYGYQSSNKQLQSEIRGKAILQDDSDYVVENSLLQLPPDANTDAPTEVMLTMLVDPRGIVPAACGATPLKEISLSPGPVAQAMDNIVMTFRTGPVLVDPAHLSMPLPGKVKGKWSWLHRTGVTVWREDSDIDSQEVTASFNTNPPVLQQGWLKLSSALTDPDNDSIN